MGQSGGWNRRCVALASHRPSVALASHMPSTVLACRAVAAACIQMAVAAASMHLYVYLRIFRFCLSGLVEFITHTQTIQYDFLNETKKHKCTVCGARCCLL